MQKFSLCGKSITSTPAMLFNQYNPHPIKECRVKTIGWIKNMIVVSTTIILQLQHIAQYMGFPTLSRVILKE
jgi:hypothetical protein